ncbi:MAG TPA: endonuclease/exonuclease/phosphatase family protein [Actinospica sp.]|jgi:endonuclease/exonuclease/phosphatase family metal-dependent hydrolase|nr:endonuclease/exonuclease/phosphatase family protein [Actinospica sp.]
MIKIVTWNLKDLFRAGARETRVGAIGQVLKQIEADIVCVQEIRGADPGRSLARLGEAAGLDWRARPGWIDYEDGDGELPTAAVGIGDADFHVGLLWREDFTPIPGTWRQIGRAQGGLWHAAASIDLQVGGPVPLTVVSCHLDPFRPEARFSEAARIVSLTQDKTAMVGADYNGPSADRRTDGSYYDPDPIEQRGWHSAATYQVAWDDDPNAAPRVDRRAAERLRRAGLVDAAAVLDAPWQPSCGHWPDDPHGPRRIDRILATPTAKPALVSYAVVDTEITRALSDHLPVVVEFDPARLT